MFIYGEFVCLSQQRLHNMWISWQFIEITTSTILYHDIILSFNPDDFKD